jgi:hypothetical protein
MLPFTSVNMTSFIHQSSVYNLLQVIIKSATLPSSFSISLHSFRREEKKREKGREYEGGGEEKRRKNSGRERGGGTRVKQ